MTQNAPFQPWYPQISINAPIARYQACNHQDEVKSFHVRIRQIQNESLAGFREKREMEDYKVIYCPIGE
jgi:hypothetical protein